MTLDQMRQAVATFEALDAEQENSSSKYGYRSWMRSQIYMDGIILKTNLVSAERRTAQATRPARTWRDDPATQNQITYLLNFGVEIERNLTKGRASELINAAKTDGLNSIGGWRYDGSN